MVYGICWIGHLILPELVPNWSYILSRIEWRVNRSIPDGQDTIGLKEDVRPNARIALASSGGDEVIILLKYPKCAITGIITGKQFHRT